MNNALCEVESTDPTQHEKWLKKHGFNPNAAGEFSIDKFEGKLAVPIDTLFENIRINVANADYVPLYTEPFDDRTFVMVCGGPSLAEHLDEIREKSLSERFLVVCSNRTGSYLLENAITAGAHFILDPQEKKKFDVAMVSMRTEYWINVACHPGVFSQLRHHGITPHVFLADFESEGRARQAVAESMLPGQPGMMAIQGGTMAGLRAINLADARGFRKMEYYGFDATARINGKKAQLYAYEKKRGEAIIEVNCDECSEKFDTTLILQKQVNEFLDWSRRMPWMDIKIIGGGLIAHCQQHFLEKKARVYHNPERYTPEYASLQRELHAGGEYGVSGRQFIPTIFHGISQLAKRLGSVRVLDYGSAGGQTMQAVREHLWLPPDVREACYDPFVEEFSQPPEPADFVICTDVMEHVEPQCTQSVLDHIASLTRRIAFFSIALQKAKKTLSDGRNAHINLRDAEFWLAELKKRFILSEARVHSGEVLMAIGQSINDVRQIIKERRNGSPP